MGLSDIKTYAIVALIVAILGGGGIFGFLILKDDTVTVDAVTDNSIEYVMGTGTYDKGSSACIYVQVHTGWIFDGIYSPDGELLSEKNEMTFTINSDYTFHFRTHRGYGVEAYGDGGVLSINGGGSYEKIESAQVSVTLITGYTFNGWVDADGKTVSSDNPYTLKSKEDTVLIAKTSYSSSSGTNKVTRSSDRDFDLTTTKLIVINKYSGEYIYSKSGVKGFELNLAPGVYEWMVIGKLNNGEWCKTVNTFVVKGDIENKYVWIYNSKQYSITLKVSSSVYEQYCDKNSGGRAPSSDSSRAAFVNYNSAEVKAIAEKLNAIATTEKMTVNQRANFVLKFVQRCTDYETDAQRYGQIEHWKYPLETIFERKGDCEDTSILYCALMKAMGNDTCLLLYLGDEYAGRGHAASGVVVNYFKDGFKYYIDGKYYYFCETTSDDMNVGDQSEGYNKTHYIVIG